MSRRTNVNVVLAIGDIYDYSEMPAPFHLMAKVFRYDRDAINTQVTLDVSDEIQLVMTAISLAPFSTLLECKTREFESDFTSSADAHLRAVKYLINDPRNSPLIQIGAFHPHILVMGQTVLFEAITKKFYSRSNCFEPLIVRFSSFYPGVSIHTGKKASEVGYDIDMPKNLGLLKNLLSYEPFLKAVLAKNEKSLMATLLDLNLRKEFAPNPALWVK